jgi:hypothetical protein
LKPYLFEWGLLVTILNPKNVRFELRDAALVLACGIYDIKK